MIWKYEIKSLDWCRRLIRYEPIQVISTWLKVSRYETMEFRLKLSHTHKLQHILSQTHRTKTCSIVEQISVPILLAYYCSLSAVTASPQWKFENRKLQRNGICHCQIFCDMCSCSQQHAVCFKPIFMEERIGNGRKYVRVLCECVCVWQVNVKQNSVCINLSTSPSVSSACSVLVLVTENCVDM